MDTKMIFANKLLEMRENKNLTRQKVADDLGISRASLEYYEKGKRTPDINTISQISDYFGVSIDYLMGKSECASRDENIQTVCNFFNVDVSMVLGIKKLLNENKKYTDEFQKIIFSSYFQMFLYHIFYSWKLRTELGYEYLNELEDVSKYMNKDSKELYEQFDIDGYSSHYGTEISRLTNEIELNEYKSQKLFLNSLLNCNSQEYSEYEWDSYEQYLNEFVPTETFLELIEDNIENAKDEIKYKIQDYLDSTEGER